MIRFPFMHTSESGILWQRRTIVPARLIRFLDKMVNTILSCESFAGRRWLLKQQPNKTVFNRFIENWYQPYFCPAFSV